MGATWTCGGLDGMSGAQIKEGFSNFSQPLQNASTLEDIQRHPWPRVEWFDFSEIKCICNQFKGYAISTPGIHIEGHHGVFHLMTYLFGFEKVMVDLALNPELVRAAIERVMAFLVSYYDQFFKISRRND